MSRILSREKVRLRVSGSFFKSVVQSVLLFGSEIWVVTLRMGRFLEGLQGQVPRRLMGRLPYQRLYGRWDYTLVEAEREEMGYERMETSIWRRHIFPYN